MANKDQFKTLSRLIASYAVRDNMLETFHEGTSPASASGDYLDVKVVSPYGSIPWDKLSRLNDQEMRILMLDIEKHIYKLLGYFNHKGYLSFNMPKDNLKQLKKELFEYGVSWDLPKREYARFTHQTEYWKSAQRMLSIITDEEAWSKKYDYSTRQFEYRTAVRAVVINSDKKVALIHATKPNTYGLPGGGIETGERIGTALKREILEETGAEVDEEKRIATIMEVRYKPHSDLGKIQVNYCYFTKVNKVVAEPTFSGKEIENDCKLLWVSYDEAVKLIANMGNKVEDFIKFAQLRDLEILGKVRNKIT